MAISAEVLLLFLLVFVSTQRYKFNQYFRFLPYFLVFIFMAIRADFGDGFVYRAEFENLQNGNNWRNWEPLWVALNRLMPNFRAVIIVTSLIYVLAFYYIISKALSYKQRPLALAVLMIHPYILMVDMSAMRQSIAIAIIMLGAYTANKYRGFYFIPFCLLAALFHKSAIVLLPIVVLFNQKPFSRKIKWGIFGGTIFFLTFHNIFFHLLYNMMTAAKLYYYRGYLYSVAQNGKLAVILSLIMLAFLLLCGDVVSGTNAIYVKLSVLAMAIEAMQGCVQQLGRIDMYFLPFLVLALPLILKEKYLKIQFFHRSIVVNQYGCWIVQACLLAMFAKKLMGFMTPQYMYHTIFTIG